MASWNHPVSGGDYTQDLSLQGIDGARASFHGLTIRAGVFVIPVDRLTGDTGAEDSHLAQSMGQLSLVGGECLDASSCSVNNLSRAAHLPNGKKIVADMLVLEGKDAVLSYSQSYDYGIEGTKQLFHIAPRTILLSALKSVGISDPVFMHVGFKGAFQVHIQFESPLPLCIERGTKLADIAGDVCGSYQLAEASAVKKAFDHLYKMHNVVLVDISYRKESERVRASRDQYCNVMDGLRHVGTMVQHWHECVNKLYQVEKLAYSKMKYGTQVELSFSCPLFEFIQTINVHAMPRIRSCDAKHKHLTARKDDYVEASRSQPLSYRKASIIKAYHHEVDVLSLLVQWLGLEECQYSAAPGDDGRFLGAVMLSFPFGQRMAPPGDMCIEADTEERTIEEAKNRAARQAIFFIEDRFNVEVVGLNHNKVVAADHELSLISLINEVMFLGATVAKYWEEMINKVDECVHANKHATTLIVPEPRMDDGTSFINNLVVQFELAAVQCTKLFKVDVAKFESLN